MASQQTLKRLDALAWTLIYAGLFMLILGIAAHGQARVAGWSLSVLGSLAASAGVVLILVRARLTKQDAPDRRR
ncbi:MAG: putative rane protein [Ramlibacter sp.]|jgi:uncharacterized membrane-anchored protein|nr:putative rane protein [Ramlibacter sp.]